MTGVKKVSVYVIGEISGRRYTRESFIAGLGSNKLIAPLCYTGTCDTILFNFWIKNFLLPELGPGYTIIMDNTAFHKSEETKRKISWKYYTLSFFN